MQSSITKLAVCPISKVWYILITTKHANNLLLHVPLTRNAWSTLLSAQVQAIDYKYF